jgi:hypothetical protein
MHFSIQSRPSIKYLKVFKHTKKSGCITNLDIFTRIKSLYEYMYIWCIFVFNLGLHLNIEWSTDIIQSWIAFEHLKACGCIINVCIYRGKCVYHFRCAFKHLKVSGSMSCWDINSRIKCIYVHIYMM